MAKSTLPTLPSLDIPPYEIRPKTSAKGKAGESAEDGQESG
jgi:hypothetical protein